MPDNRLVDGQLSWERGVNSARIPTIASPSYPQGLDRNALAWLINATVRGGGILQRTGWQQLIQDATWEGLYQGCFMYQPDFNDPYLIVAVGGRIYRVRVDTDNSIEDLSALNGLTLPTDQPQYFFAQAEQFLVIQCGDLVTPPLFYFEDSDGNPRLRVSNGFNAPGDPNNEIPPAGPMDYWANRLWYAIGRRYCAGDIVLSQTSGTNVAPFFFGYRDSVLKTTENPVAKAGDGFIVPTVAGNIRALKHTTNLDTALGQSPLFVFTRSAIYACEAPITRDEWKLAGFDKMPLQKIALIKGGTYSDRSVVPVNGDLYFQSIPNGDIRSLLVALRYFQQPGNVPISRNENRVLAYNDRALLRYGSGIEFNNRLFETALPVQTARGVAHQSIMSLDFDLISTLEDRLPPAWEGIYEGLDFLQLSEGDFGGLQRAFSFTVSRVTGNIDLWEFTQFDRWDKQHENDGDRVTWVIEFPAYTWGDPLTMKKLTGGAIWLDKILGNVEFLLEYRPNQWPCWIKWHAWKECTAKDCRDFDGPSCVSYGDVQPFCESFMPDREFPAPTPVCIGANNRPSNIAYQFQARLTIKGWCRIRGFLIYAEKFQKTPYGNMSCPEINKSI